MARCEKCHQEFATDLGFLSHDCKALEACTCGLEAMILGHQETCPLVANTCQSDGCRAEAAYTVFWPSQTRRFCLSHASQAKGLADALGFNLDMRRI